MKIDTLIDRGWVPDFVMRRGIRRLLRARLARLETQTPEEALASHLAMLREAPVAPVPEEANAQHYEVPPAFFAAVLGPHAKYSCALYPDETRPRPDPVSLGDAEAAMLGLSCERADLQDGQRILELGCGWGSLSLFMAERCPQSRILGVSNSRTQRPFILEKAATRGHANLEIQTADVNTFSPPLAEGERYDRIVSVEMFEHAANWPALFERLRGWIADDGRVFIHVFAHRSHPYPFQDEGKGDWMARHFFTGGQMPSVELLPAAAAEHFEVAETWWVNGTHYARTARAWLENLDRQRKAMTALLAPSAPGGDGRAAVRRWRVFFMACEELWGFNGGETWGVAHYALKPRSNA